MGQKVRDIMDGVLLHADKDERLEEVIRLLHLYNADAILVRDNGMPKGMITARDVIRCLATMNTDPQQIWARDIMSSYIPIEDDADIEMAREMVKIHSLIPVKKDYDIVGLLTTSDLLVD